MTPRRITKHAMLLLHGESLAEHGGSSGVRDEVALDAALAPPQKRFAHAKPDLHELAAAYGFGIAQNPPFVDGNKRAAFLAIGLFLCRNGWSLDVTQVEATRAILQLAAGEASEEQLAAWIRKNAVPRLAPKSQS